MRTVTVMSALLLVMFATGSAQNSPPAETRGPQPLYEVTIVSRTTKALNYGYLSAPTRIDFKATPVLTGARGEATVEPKRGSTLLNMRFEDVPPPTRFGAQYLTYVVWAISPDGRPQNLGELMLDGSGKARLSTSSPLQTFAMIVTAEPYFSVTQPSEVVVMENAIGQGTIGKVEEVKATYELLPRKAYTYDLSAQTKSTGKPLDREEYESITALYQALNAIQIAQSMNADKYAPDGMARARQLYNQARTYPTHLNKEIVSMARAATQVAEDSRAVAVKRADAEKAAAEQRRSGASPIEPETTATRASEPPSDPPPARPQPEATAAPPVRTPLTPETSSPVEVDQRQFLRDRPEAQENRKRLLAAMPGTYDVVDSSRGIVVTLPADLARSKSLQSNLATVAAAIKPYQDLHIEVEGHTDDANAAVVSERDAETVRLALMGAGVSPNVIVAKGLGNSRPRATNATEAGRRENRRVEIVIAGDAIGTLASWDRTYKLQPVEGVAAGRLR
jgi:outer membrane protein OmpA-like peptidoglycan-associated protein